MNIDKSKKFLIDALEAYGATKVEVHTESVRDGNNVSNWIDSGIYFTMPSGEAVCINPTDDHPEDPILQWWQSDS